MLKSVGIDGDAITVYRAMLANPEANVEQLGQICPLSADRLRTALDRLRSAKLVVPRWTGGTLHGAEYAVHPRFGLPALIERRRAELHRELEQVRADELEVNDLAIQYSELLASRAGPEVEILEGQEKANLRMQQFSLEESALALNPTSPSGASSPEESPDRPGLERGIEFRTIYLQSHLRSKNLSKYVSWLVSMGAGVRYAPSLPMRLLIFDRKAAVVPLDLDDIDAGAVVHHGETTVSLAIYIFDMIWHQSIEHPDLKPRSVAVADLTAQELELLRLLSDGATDEQAARKLGVSLRTIRRLAARLCERTGASGRFELGMRAALNGWIR